jgi:hypothetical protein
MLTLPASAGRSSSSIGERMPPKSNQGNGHGNHSESGEFRNHGAEVSAAAHATPKGHGEAHGQAVSDVARGNAKQPTPANPSTAADVAADDSEPGA